MELCALQVKTSYSLLHSLNRISSLVEIAKSYGYTSLAITDSNNMFGVMEFYLECKKNGIKPIIGLELTVFDKKILLYAKNNNGYKNIVKLSTIVSERNITRDDLLSYRDDIILIMPIFYKDEDIMNIYNESYTGYTSIEEKNKIDEHNKVFINDVLYINESDYKYLDYLIMIDENKILGEYELGTHKNYHLLKCDELNKILNDEDKDIINRIVESCDVEIGYIKGLLPVYDENIEAFSYLTKICNKGLNKRLNGNVTKIYQDRLNYELDIINEMGFCNYFLIVWDYVKYAKFNNILVGPGRGSAAGSLVSYTLGITDIDPIKYNLLFERFLNPERITMPDIDIDFEATRRNEVIDYVTLKYGEKRVAGIITFNTLAAKQVIRDVSRVMNINLRLVDEITRLISNNTLSEAYNDIKLKRLIDSSTNLQKMYDIALHLEGLPRHISVHAAGIIISRINIDEVIPLYKNQLGMYTTAYSMNYLEDLGLLKMDFLSLSNLTLIEEVIANVKSKEHLNITFSNIPMDDKKTYDIFYKVDTEGIFQFESVGMKRFLKKLHINCMEDIVAAIALFRPGPMDNIDTYIKRKEGREEVDYISDSLKEILKPTYGIIIYQEQIMQIARVLASYSLAEADLLRRAMSKKKEEILINEKAKFVERSINNGYSRKIAVKVYELILKFANYGFNRSHSVAYAIIAYKMAFLKTYFFKYFMTSLLTNSIGSEIKTKRYIQEIRAKNIKILLPSINFSGNKYIAEDGGIRCPLSIIRNVGTVISNAIANERNKGLFTSYYDFIIRMYKQGINNKVLISLINAGCFSEFGYNRRTLINNIETIVNYAELESDRGLITIEKPLIVDYEEYSKEELVVKELEVFGFYLSEHPISRYRKDNDVTLLNVHSYFDRQVELLLLVDKIKEVTTKNNDVMAFIQTSDEYDEISLTLFPLVYKEYNNVKVGDIIRVKGRVEKRFDKYQIVVNSIIVVN